MGRQASIYVLYYRVECGMRNIRDGAAFFPNGSTILEPGDEVVALTRGVHEPRLRSLFFSEH